jgi:hypothetical protein
MVRRVLPICGRRALMNPTISADHRNAGRTAPVKLAPAL